MDIKRAKGHGKYATYEVNAPELRFNQHVKLRPASHANRLIDESRRTNWANEHGLPAPTARAIRLPGIALLISKTIEGRPSHEYIDIVHPEIIIRGLSRALETISRVDIMGFPFVAPHWATQQGTETNVKKLTSKKHRELHPDFARLTTNELRNIIDTGPNTQLTTLNHGDSCMPNVLLNVNGDISGIVDLGGLHIGNDKLDLSIMSWTIQANMGTKWADQFLDLHGATTQDQGILYNRLSYDLGLERENPWAWTQTDKLAAQRERLSEYGASND